MKGLIKSIKFKIISEEVFQLTNDHVAVIFVCQFLVLIVLLSRWFSKVKRLIHHKLIFFSLRLAPKNKINQSLPLIHFKIISLPVPKFRRKLSIIMDYFDVFSTIINDYNYQN